jgi:putative transposase
VLVHGIWVERTHVHLVVTDTKGKLSAFMQWLNRLVALCLLEHYRDLYPRRTLQKIWSAGSFNQTLLVTPESVLEAYVYGATNVVKDGLVPRHDQWPGLASKPSDWLEPTRTATRPKLFFNQRRIQDATIDYRFTIPPQFRERTPERFASEVARMIEEEERTIHATRGSRPFVGVKAILAADPFDSPKSPRTRGERCPTVKAGTGQTAAYQLAIQAVRAFREAYRAARRLFCAGKEAVFPAGTLMLRSAFGVPCAREDFSAWCCLG